MPAGETRATPLIVHASCVAIDGNAVMIRGASGTGKSSLALQLIALGADLVADDRTCLFKTGAKVFAEAPETIRGMIEARGVGILTARAFGPAQLALVIDLDQTEDERLPPARSASVLGQSYPLLHKVDSPHFPAAILQYVKARAWQRI